MAKLGITAEQAFEALNIHGDERELVIKLLAERFSVEHGERPVRSVSRPASTGDGPCEQPW